MTSDYRLGKKIEAPAKPKEDVIEEMGNGLYKRNGKSGAPCGRIYVRSRVSFHAATRWRLSQKRSGLAMQTDQMK